MTQIQTNFTLPGSDMFKNLQSPDVYSSELYFSRNTTSELPSASSPLHELISIPPFIENNPLAGQLDTVDLGNPVRKKVRHSAESPGSPTVTLPSTKHTFSMISLWPHIVDHPIVIPENDSTIIPDNIALSGKAKNLPQKRTSKAGVGMGTVIDENGTEEKPTIEKPKVKSLRQKELKVKTKLKAQEQLSNQELDTNSAVETLSSSTHSNSPNLRIQEEYQLPKVFSPDFSELTDQTSKQLQQALLALQGKICNIQQQEVDLYNIEKQQDHLLVDIKTPVYAILDNISKANESANLNDQQILSLFMNDSKVKNLVTYMAFNNPLEELAPQANIAYPVVDIKENVKSKREKGKFKEEKSSNQFATKMLEEIEVVRSESGDKEAMTVGSRTEIKRYTQEEALEQSDDSTNKKNKAKGRKTVKQETSSEEGKTINKKENEKSNKASKVIHKEFRKETVSIKRKMTKVTAKTKKGVILVSPWSIDSKRRMNKWQLNEHSAAKSPTAETKKEVKSPKVVIPSIHMEGVEIKETPVGTGHQVPIPTMIPKRAKNDRKRFPQLKWNPTALTKSRLEYYFKDLGEKLQCEDISQERAIRLLRDHNWDPKKVYKTIEGREKEFLREFIVRPKRKP